MRFSRTRLTDVLHRPALGFYYHGHQPAEPYVVLAGCWSAVFRQAQPAVP
jgi:hypothetical protein